MENFNWETNKNNRILIRYDNVYCGVANKLYCKKESNIDFYSGVIYRAVCIKKFFNISDNIEVIYNFFDKFGKELTEEFTCIVTDISPIYISYDFCISDVVKIEKVKLLKK